MKKLIVKIALRFAVIGYLVTIVLYFVSVTWHPRLSPRVVLAVSPAYLLTMISMTDPSFGAIAAIVAPLNALLYGVIGLFIGLSAEDVRSRKSNRRAS